MYVFGGSMSLLRVSTDHQVDEQVKKMIKNDKKKTYEKREKKISNSRGPIGPQNVGCHKNIFRKKFQFFFWFKIILISFSSHFGGIFFF